MPTAGMIPAFTHHISRGVIALVGTRQGVPGFPPDMAAAMEGHAITCLRPYTLEIRVVGKEDRYNALYIERRLGTATSLYVSTRKNGVGHAMTMWLACTLVKYAKLCGRAVYEECSEEGVVSFLVGSIPPPNADVQVVFTACRNDGRRFRLHNGTIALPREE